MIIMDKTERGGLLLIDNNDAFLKIRQAALPLSLFLSPLSLSVPPLLSPPPSSFFSVSV